MELPLPDFASAYFNRYTEDAVDLCDLLSSFSPHTKASLHELCRVMELSGKPEGMSGGRSKSIIAMVASVRLRNTARAMS